MLAQPLSAERDAAIWPMPAVTGRRAAALKRDERRTVLTRNNSHVLMRTGYLRRNPGRADNNCGLRFLARKINSFSLRRTCATMRRWRAVCRAEMVGLH